MKMHVIAAAALCALAAAPAMAQQKAEGPWQVRVRAVHIDSANKDNIAISDVSINNKTIPEVDISYYFTPNIAAELILTYPQKHDVSSTAHGGKIGTLKHLPPTLTLQYHFPMDGFKPYVGAGINYTRFSNVDLAGGAATVDKNSFGFALQAGVDIPVGNNLSLNFDVKKVQIRTDVTLAGTNIGEFKVDPLLVGVGLGWRF